MTGVAPLSKIPAWARQYPEGVQRVVIAHQLTGIQLRALMEFREDPGAELVLSHSTARALRSRDLGDLTGKFRSGTGSMDRNHPRSGFRLNEKGQAVAVALADATSAETLVPPTRDDVSYSNGYGALRWDREPKPPRAKNPNYHPAEWDQ